MIHFDKCSIGYDEVILHELELFIGDNEVITVLGPTGIGKSTFLRLIGGVDRTSSRPVVLAGTYEKKADMKIGIVFQTLDQLFPWKNAIDNVVFPCLAKTKNIKDPGLIKRSKTLLSEVGLRDHMYKYPMHMSGGMRQRVAIARAMMSTPDLLLMDEPFSSLDAITREKLQDLLLTIQAKHQMTIVFITHDIDEAIKLSNRILLIDGYGRSQVIRCNDNDDKMSLKENIKKALKKVSDS